MTLHKTLSTSIADSSTKVPGVLFSFKKNAQNESLLLSPFYLRKKTTLNKYITCPGYINNYKSPFIGPIKVD